MVAVKNLVFWFLKRRVRVICEGVSARGRLAAISPSSGCKPHKPLMLFLKTPICYVLMRSWDLISLEAD
jgi:hypothetical protein